PGQNSACYDATGNCFGLAVSNPASRPALHWDAAFSETVGGSASKSWTVHVGASFSDVPPAHPFYAPVETLLHRHITAGCSGASFCPSAGVTRAQMAVFLLKAKLGGRYAPP